MTVIATSVLVTGKDEPGAFGQTTRQIADAGVNVDLIYLAKRTRLVLGGADADQIRAALGTS